MFVCLRTLEALTREADTEYAGKIASGSSTDYCFSWFVSKHQRFSWFCWYQLLTARGFRRCVIVV